MSIFVENQEMLKKWASNKLKIGFSPNSYFIGQVLNNELRAVAAYCSFQGQSCNFHLCSTGNYWMNKEFLQAIFEYPFIVARLKIMLAIVSGENKKSLNLSNRFGFKEVANIPYAHQDGNLVIFTMQSNDCKWLNIRSN